MNDGIRKILAQCNAHTNGEVAVSACYLNTFKIEKEKENGQWESSRSCVVLRLKWMEIVKISEKKDKETMIYSHLHCDLPYILPSYSFLTWHTAAHQFHSSQHPPTQYLYRANYICREGNYILFGSFFIIVLCICTVHSEVHGWMQMQMEKENSLSIRKYFF